MPHIIIEYTDNIKQEANIPFLLEKISKSLIARASIFPVGGIRLRAIELKEYLIADGEEDYAFVHAICKIGSGRSEEDKKAVCADMFEIIKKHFSSLMEKRYLALSLELYEFGEAGTMKYNNIHERFKKEKN
ncbi:5-carboxymethyl-2-hydroxymuconate delta isomerase [Bacillus sp. OV322]|uniref:5-carboxymethyl-2-hydroxymuconate Delta-isomerase n=1 Tax=Bacillus sp. OV322 TaxID=1882764 RepID=UPI0008EB7F90|nr:5-carboxymethyl-2-hydroxymuconate Delta-isomerase [Bacillus sp. OV322]SFC71669.1 5-carboxymethyl-2-hydroxymuconate delta isomerase [Bacillus sp. OV322]